MKLVRGFLMAWGCFCWIPCPYKKWNDDDRTAMVAMLPLVGTGLGLLTAVVWMILSALGAAPVLSGAVVTAAYFVMTGFIHLDGFMDVSDAVMPRHPRMEERIRILKDPHTGSFAAISMALMFLIFAASAAVLSEFWCAGALVFIAVATVSRCVSAMTVINCRPMGTSQYATTDFGKGRSFAQSLPALVIAVVVVGACTAFCFSGAEITEHLPGSGIAENLSGAGIAGLTGGAGTGKLIAAVPGWHAAICVLVSSAVCAATELILGVLDRRALGGMNGDISGHMITSGEMAGMLAAAILMG